ncbi:MAG: hypothetical protein GX321_02500 [Clostridiales bacterium]|nr:hypothetical protein [Clostridiales bacterium]
MIIDFNQPNYYYEDLVTDAGTLTKQYKNILKYVTIGKSHDNRDIIMLQLGLGRRHILFCGGVHGRETINPIVIMKLAEDYADKYESYKRTKKLYDLKVKSTYNNIVLHSNESYYNKMIIEKCVYELLQTYTFLMIPLLNPDGYMISLNGFNSIHNKELRYKIKQMGIPCAQWKFNARAVDINRNFPCRTWKPKGSHDYAASENETKTLIEIFHKYPIRCFFDFHSRGKYIYYYRNSMNDKYNEINYNIAKHLKNVTGYGLVKKEDEIDYGDSGGNTVHYFSERFIKPAITIETVDEYANFPLDIKYRLSTFEEVKLILLELGACI